MKSKKILIVPKHIITVNERDEIYYDKAIEISDGIITSFIDKDKIEYGKYDGEIYNVPDYTLIPGFIQTHVHLCQTLFRGLADDLELLDWLQKRIFPYEMAHNPESLRVSAQLGIHELQTSGTTTILDMGTINHQEVVFESLIEARMRAFSGKCMVDENELMPEFKETTEESLRTSYELAKKYHNTENGKIKYAFAPRFVLSCSGELLRKTYEMLSDFPGALYHSHTSENKDEVEEVRRRYNMENVEYFDSLGVLSENTVLAHGIHVSESERKTLKKTGTRIAHCPSANLKLGSGIANIPEYLKEGVSVSLGADGPPCNNNLSMFKEMRLAALIQKPIHGSTSMDALTVFRLATIEGAKALHIDNYTGSIEPGKKADLVLLDLNKTNQSLLDNEENLYSDIVYSAGKENVKDVMIEGEWVVRNGRSLIYDENKLVEKGREELKKLLERANVK